jgi:Cyanate permease
MVVGPNEGKALAHRVVHDRCRNRAFVERCCQESGCHGDIHVLSRGRGYLRIFPKFLGTSTSFLTGTAAAASIGLINSIGNLGGFVGPYLVGYLSNKTGSFISGVLYLALSALIASAMILSLRAAKKE